MDNPDTIEFGAPTTPPAEIPFGGGNPPIQGGIQQPQGQKALTAQSFLHPAVKALDEQLHPTNPIVNYFKNLGHALSGKDAADRIKEDFTNKPAITGNPIKDTLGAARTGLHIAGDIGSAVSDVFGALTKPAADVAVNTIKSDPLWQKPAVKKSLDTVKQLYDKFSMAHPEVVKSAGDLLNIAGVIFAPSGVEDVANLARGAGANLAKLGDSTINTFTRSAESEAARTARVAAEAKGPEIAKAIKSSNTEWNTEISNQKGKASRVAANAVAKGNDIGDTLSQRGITPHSLMGEGGRYETGLHANALDNEAKTLYKATNGPLIEQADKMGYVGYTDDIKNRALEYARSFHGTTGDTAAALKKVEKAFADIEAKFPEGMPASAMEAEKGAHWDNINWSKVGGKDTPTNIFESAMGHAYQGAVEDGVEEASRLPKGTVKAMNAEIGKIRDAKGFLQEINGDKTAIKPSASLKGKIIKGGVKIVAGGVGELLAGPLGAAGAYVSSGPVADALTEYLTRLPQVSRDAVLKGLTAEEPAMAAKIKEYLSASNAPDAPRRIIPQKGPTPAGDVPVTNRGASTAGRTKENAVPIRVIKGEPKPRVSVMNDVVPKTTPLSDIQAPRSAPRETQGTKVPITDSGRPAQTMSIKEKTSNFERKPATKATKIKIQGSEYTPTNQKIADIFDQSGGQKTIKVGDTDYQIGDFGRKAYDRKGLKGDRFQETELKKTLENTTDVVRGSDNPANYRYDNVAHISTMPDGETRVVYTRENRLGNEEVINWHSVSNQKYVDDLLKNGAPDQSRTGILNLEGSRPNPLNDRGNVNISQNGKNVNSVSNAKAKPRLGGGGAQMTPIYQGENDLTTKVLERLKGHDIVSKQFINDLAKSGDLKQVERDLVAKTLKESGDTVYVKEFANRVKTELLPLEVSKPTGTDRYGSVASPKYENITLPDELRGPVANYQERIYQSPIKTSAADVHFGGLSSGKDEFPGYFAHSRIEDLPAKGKTFSTELSMAGDPQSTILEMKGAQLDDQIDFAKGLLKTEKQAFTSEEIKSLKDALKSEYEPDGSDTGKIFNKVLKYYRENELGNSGKTRRVIELQSDLFQKGRLETEGLKGTVDLPKMEGTFSEKYLKAGELRKAELAKLEPYRNTWHERIIREEVKQAAKDGKTLLQFPTGETAMKIEGLGGNEGTNRWWDVASDTTGRNAVQLKPEDLKVGKPVYDGHSNWVITDVLGDGKFKAVPSDARAGAIEKIRDFTKEAGEPMPRGFELEKIINDEMDTWKESFDISGKVDTKNPIFNFYEKTVGKYLKNNYGASVITDPQGVKWQQVKVPKAAATAPVEARRNKVKSDLNYA